MEPLDAVDAVLVLLDDEVEESDEEDEDDVVEEAASELLFVDFDELGELLEDALRLSVR